MNKKQKSSIILASLASIAVAGSVIAGSTYALFTSDAKTNIAVTSGKVSVTATVSGLKTYSGVKLTGDTSTDTISETATPGFFTNGGTATYENGTLTLDKITPGDKVTFDIDLTSDTNVAAKYRTVIQVISDDGLFDGLEITVDGNTWSSGYSVVTEYKTLTETLNSLNVVVDFPSDRDDTYQDRKCTVQILIEAVQGNAYTGEWDPTALYLYNERDLTKFAKEVNDGETFEGRKIKLAKDVDLSAVENWTSIGSGVRASSSYEDGAKVFKGTFDGEYKTIKYKLSSTATGDTCVGLFAIVDGGTIQNLNLSADITATTSECLGAAVGLAVGNAQIKNVKTLKGSTIAGYKGVGGIVGRMTIEGTISGCENNATITSASGNNIGGIVGAAYYTDVDKEMTITNCKNFVTISGGNGIGGIVGLSSANISNCSNSAEIKGNNFSVGGIVGEQQNYGSITGCVNSGSIKNTHTSAYGTGGIVGWVRYSGATTAYKRAGIVSLLNNENSGNIQGAGSAGGIAGHVYNAIVADGNKNTATSISGSTFMAGIIGSIQNTETPITGINKTDFTIINNNSSTTLEQMNGTGGKALIVYVNPTPTGDDVLIIQNNTPNTQDNA